MTTMNATSKEYISMLMDGDNVSDEIIDRLLTDDAATQAWYEYHLIGDCIRYQEGAGRDAEFMQSAAFTATLAEISAEHKERYEAEVAAAAPVQNVQAANHSFFKSFAVAASLAAVAVGAWQFDARENGETAGMVAEKAAETKAPQENIVPVAVTPSARSASDTVVMPDSAKNDKGENQTTARVEMPSRQDSVVH